MKKVKMIQVFFILICVCSYLIGSAQSDYLVTAKNDTIRGQAKILNFNSGTKVQIITADGTKSVFSILQTKYVRTGNESYAPIRFEQKYLLMKILKSGYLSLYAFQPADQTQWNGRYLLKRDGWGHEVPNIGFKKFIIQYLYDCPDLTAKIESKILAKDDLYAIIDHYNACIDAKTQRLLPNKPVTTDDGKTVTISGTEWDKLETMVQQLDFESKKDALDMITEIKSKINKNESIPNFLMEGLKNALKDQTSTKETLYKAIQDIKKP